jgi:hypothetical protein
MEIRALRAADERSAFRCDDLDLDRSSCASRRRTSSGTTSA